MENGALENGSFDSLCKILPGSGRPMAAPTENPVGAYQSLVRYRVASTVRYAFAVKLAILFPFRLHFFPIVV
jgi:hypothetical protein